MVKGLEGKTYEGGAVEVPWLVQPRAEQAEGRPHGGLQLPHEGSGGAGAELCSLGTATGPEGTAWSWDRGGSGWVLGKGSAPRGGRALGQAPQGSGQGTESDRIQEAFGQHSQAFGLILGWSCMEPGVGLHDPCGFLATQDILRFYESQVVFFVCLFFLLSG